MVQERTTRAGKIVDTIVIHWFENDGMLRTPTRFKIEKQDLIKTRKRREIARRDGGFSIVEQIPDDH